MTVEEIVFKIKSLEWDIQNLNLDNSRVQKITMALSSLNNLVQNKVSEANTDSEDLEKDNRQRSSTFNGMSAKEWVLNSRNVWSDVFQPPRTKEEAEHGATYPKSLTDRLISMYSKEGDLVFDPFLGTGTSLMSAIFKNRDAVGIELSPEFFEFAQRRVNSEYSMFSTCDVKLYNDNCMNLDKYLKDESVQLTVTSPPYADFIQKSLEDRAKVHKDSIIKNKNKSSVRQYSTSKEDFGNLPYDDFLKEAQALLSLILKKTKSGGYGAWVVKDYRDTKNGIPYVDFHSDLAKVGEAAGFKYHDLIVWDQNENRSLFLQGYPSKFYTNQNCSFIVVFRKD